MNSQVIPFNNDDLRIEELKNDDGNPAGGNDGSGGINYESFMKKCNDRASHGKSKSDVFNHDQSYSNNRGNQDMINGGTGRQDLKSESSMSTKTGGEDYLNDNVVEDVRVGNMLLNQIKISEWISNYFAMSTIAAGIIEYELATTYVDTDTIDGIRSSLLSVCAVTTF